MPLPTSLSDVDLSPLPGKTYFSTDREWREEFVYFLLVDRFHNDSPRAPTNTAARSSGVKTPDDFYGGTIKGITEHLDYIAELGCNAVWLSPVFENNARAYHGYNINNYLRVDPHFGTKEDLVGLVEVATLKDFAHDDDQTGSPLINILIKAHCYWLREADVDGFRVDAVKHMGSLAGRPLRALSPRPHPQASRADASRHQSRRRK